MKLKTLTLAGIALIGLCTNDALARTPFAKTTNIRHLNYHSAFAQKMLAFTQHCGQAKQQSSSVGKTAKTTAPMSRIIAYGSRRNDGTTYQLNDSVKLFYSGDRGGDLNSENIKFDKLNSFEISGGLVENIGQTNQTFDVKNNILSSQYDEWNGAAFENNYRDFYTYNADNKVLTDSTEEWDGSAWEITSKIIYTYTPTKKVALETSQQWNGTSWEDAVQYEYTYTAADKISSMAVKFWMGSSWVTFVKMSSTYNSSGFLISELTQIDGFGTGTFENVSRVTYTNDAAGNVLVQDDEEWDADNSVWYPTGTRLNRYDASNNKTEMIMALRDETTKAIADTLTKNSYTYNSYNQMLTDASETWNASLHVWEKVVDDYIDRYYYEEYSSATIKETWANVETKIFPVPAKDQLNINVKMEKAQALSISLTDMQGRLLQNINLPSAAQVNEQINVTAYPSGTYFIQITGENGAQQSNQIIIAH